MNRNSIKIVAISALLTFCTNPKKQYTANEIATALVGTWQTSEMFMQYKSYRDTKKDSVLLLNRYTYSDVMGTTPQLIQFDSNGDYKGYSVQLSTGDTVKSTGQWQTEANKLIIDYSIIRNEYEVHYLQTDSMAMKGIIDLDGDKEIDDKVELTIIKI